MSTKDNDPAQDPKQASLLPGATAADPAQAAAANAAPEDAAPEDAAADAVAVEPEIPGQLPGELLAARRIEMRLSIEELAARVKLAPRQLVALEANDFGALPGMATTRGFIRSCAKTMGMDPEPLLAMLAQEPNPALGPMVMRRPLPQPGFNGRRYGPSSSHRRGANKLAGLAAVMLIFVGMLAYVAWRNDWLHLPALELSASADVSSQTPDAQAQAPAAEGSAAAEPAANAPAPATAASTPVTPAAPAVPVVPAAPVTPVPTAKAGASADAEAYAPAAPSPVAPVTPAAPSGGVNADTAKAASAAKAAKAAKAANVDPARALELKLREDSWVEVSTHNGERKLVSRLIRAGSVERIEVTEPVILVVGNAAGVDVTLRGQPVSLKSGTRDNVAKVNLR